MVVVAVVAAGLEVGALVRARGPGRRALDVSHEADAAPRAASASNRFGESHGAPGRVEPEGMPGEQPDAGVEGFDHGVGEVQSEFLEG